MKKAILFFAMLFFTTILTAQTSTTDIGVEINGVIWSTRNVDEPNTFTENPEDAGMFFQWNSNIGWSSTGQIIATNGSTTWNSNNYYSETEWQSANNPCPSGWRVPTIEEAISLIGAGSEWITENSVNGRFFGSGTNKIFIPAAGCRWHNDGRLQYINEYGRYWLVPKTRTDFAMSFYFNNGSASLTDSSMPFGFSIRCVKENTENGINNVFEEITSIFPNPTKDILNITNKKNIDKIEIYNKLGVCIFKNEIFNGSINVSTLNNDIYFVKIYSGNDIVVRKFIKN